MPSRDKMGLMRDPDTTLGGPLRDFPKTSGGLIARFGDPRGQNHRALSEELCRRYWKPAYYYVRMSLARSNEDAKDLTQAFFAWLLEGDALNRYAPERASFRHYLKLLLRRFVSHDHVAAHRIKRGGGQGILPLEAGDQSLADLVPDSKAADPDKAFDEAWRSEVLHHAIAQVRARLEAAGQSTPFRIFELYDLNGEAASYAEVAQRLGLTEIAVRDHLQTVRRELRTQILDELARATGDDRDLQEEWNVLFPA